VTSARPPAALAGEPAQHRADAPQFRLLGGGLGRADEIEARASLGGGPRGDPEVVPAGIPAPGPPLGEVEDHRVGRAHQLVAQVRPPGADADIRASPRDLQRELVDIEMFVIETVLHCSLRRAAGKETGGLAPWAARSARAAGFLTGGPEEAGRG
jgi:hypothetical protein